MSHLPTGFCSSPRFIQHDTGEGHPERPDRIRAIHRALRESKLVTSPDPFPDFRIELGSLPTASEPLLEIEPIPATDQHVLLIHTPEHLAWVKRCCQAGAVLDRGDSPTCRASFDIGLLSLGSALTAADAVMSGKVRRAFSAARPPGHHAEPKRPMGFCLFSNIAIVAKHVLKTYGLDRIAIVDFDVHHGNGTQASVEDDPRIHFISTHQDPRTCYPGTGYRHETGVGNILNIPFDPGSGDAEYLAAFDEQIIPSLEKFKPQLLLISAGFDAHRDDPLAQIELSEDCFAQMTRRLVGVADHHCEGRVVSVLEGGYHLRALARGVVRHVTELII